MILKTKVNNMPGELENSDKWVVARLVDGELWFWGAYDNLSKAKQAVEEVKGVLLWM